MAVGGHSDEELLRQLRHHGLPWGPITQTTRPLYEKQLRKRLREQRESLDGENGGEGKRPLKRARREHIGWRYSSFGEDIIPGIEGNLAPSPSRRPSSRRRPAEEPVPFKFSSPLRVCERDKVDSYSDEDEDTSRNSTSILSGMFRWVEEGVKGLVERVSDAVLPHTNGRKRTTSSRSLDSIDYDILPSAPPRPDPIVPSAPPRPDPIVPSAPPRPDPIVPLTPPDPVTSLTPPSPVGVAHSFDTQYDWELLPTDVQICLRPSGEQWRIGRGGFGEVFKGLKDGVDEVAVKVIHLGSSMNSIQEEFKKEIDLISKLRHKNILQFYGACVKPGYLYMVTELMQTDLFSALRKDLRYKWSGSYGKDILLGISSGLHYLHSRRPPIVHRDIKSPNILLTGNVAKIADVGIARTKLDSDMTAQRGFTIAWAAPEVVYRRRATEKIDIWSFGIILWEVVTGKPPGPGHLVLPVNVQVDLKELYSSCTTEDYTMRPSAAVVIVTLKNIKQSCSI